VLTQLIVDDQQRKARFLLVEHGVSSASAEQVLDPVDAIASITAADVVSNRTREHVVGHRRRTRASWTS
jgi:uncharacterized DUF497 family protein